MSMSTYARRFGIVAVSGSVYVGAVYLGIQLYGGERKGQQQALLGEDGNKTTSYVLDPRRTATFQKIAYSYDDEIAKDEFVMGINLMRRALLYFHATGNVLEVGAGTGRNLGYYPSGSVKKITLTDSSDKMLEKAKEKLSGMSTAEKARHEVMVADASQLPYPDNSFDTIVDTFGLCSFDDPTAVLKELQRVCKPDGKILLLEHGRTKAYTGLSSYLDKHAERHAKNWGCVWNRDIDKIVESSGLTLEKLHNFHFGTTYYIVAKPTT
ncbi:methyltransferase [Skeletonema marinoi]|uniref:Methyltransferase n=1 Tax=Skeletonema marinoi TaxID=267567 RepID=A0AAD8YCU6_9STRA|nr:methyltransferase [Skeletonema marinoi]